MQTTSEKDSSIHAALGWLTERLGPDAFRVTDHWEPDLYAIGISSPSNASVLVYISTLGESSGLYSYELELPPEPDSEATYRAAGKGSGLTLVELVRVVKAHLSCR
jgi:hypothetical protein